MGWFEDNDDLFGSDRTLEDVIMERPVRKPPPEGDLLDTLSDAGRGFMEGATFGFAGEALAAA